MERPVSIATAEKIVANGSDKDLEDYFAIAHHRVNVSEKFEEYVEKDVSHHAAYNFCFFHILLTLSFFFP